MKHLISALLLCSPFILSGCNKGAADNTTNQLTETTDTITEMKQDTTSVKVRIETTLGDFTILLYGDTPKHRDNFVKLVKDNFYDGTLFHRVINQFMVQAGDPNSKTAQKGQMLGAGDPGYTLDAEIVFPTHFHKRYALAAARQGDQVNPQKRSSGSQFYVVTGTILDTAQISMLERQLTNQQMQSVFNDLAQQNMEKIRQMQQAGDQAGLNVLQQQLIDQTEQIVAANPIQITDEMKRVYTTIGGAPHLDGAYTVFGEVIDGFDVIDKIEKVATDRNDRPVEDVKILHTSIVE